MGKIKKYIFKKQEIYIPNIFIGGVGSTSITSKEDYLANTVGLGSVYDIKSFKIDTNNNVSLYTEINHYLGAPFLGDANVTYFIVDRGNNVDISSIELMQDYANIETIVLSDYLIADAGQFDLYNMAKLTHVDVNLANIGDRKVLSNFPILKYLYLDSIVSMNGTRGGGLIGLPSIERLYIGNMADINNSIEISSIQRNAGRGYPFLDINTSSIIYYHPNLGVKDRYAWNSIFGSYSEGDSFTLNGLVYTAIVGTPIEGQFDISSSDSTTIGYNISTAINTDTRTGTLPYNITATNDVLNIALQVDVLGVAGNAVTISFDAGNISTQTAYSPTFVGGNDIHASMVVARDLGCTLVEVDNYLKPNDIVDLSSSNITGNSVDLNFTIPSSTNLIDFYEVYIERQDLDEWHKDRVSERYKIHQEIAINGGTVLNLLSATTYKIKIRTCDEFWNRSEFSNEIEITTL